MNSGRLNDSNSRTVSKEDYPTLNRSERRNLYKIQQQFKRNYKPESFIGPQNAPTSSQEPREGPSPDLPKGTHLSRTWGALKSLLQPRRNN